MAANFIDDFGSAAYIISHEASIVAEKLFVYGTLMFPEIRISLVGREFDTFPAVFKVIGV